MQERSSLTTFNKLRPEQSLTDKGEGDSRGERKGATRLSFLCMRRARLDVFVNKLALELTQRMKYALALAVKQACKTSRDC